MPAERAFTPKVILFQHQKSLIVRLYPLFQILSASKCSFQADEKEISAQHGLQ
jgi:hypothetical protein